MFLLMITVLFLVVALVAVILWAMFRSLSNSDAYELDDSYVPRPNPYRPDVARTTYIPIPVVIETSHRSSDDSSSSSSDSGSSWSSNDSSSDSGSSSSGCASSSDSGGSFGGGDFSGGGSADSY